MPPVIGELDATAIASAIGAAMFAGVGVPLRDRPIRLAAVPEALGHA